MASRSIDTFDPLGNEPLVASRSIETFDPLGNDAPRPASILLCDRPYITVDSNETTATAKSIGGHTMAVSLWIAKPPGMSFFSVTCSKPPNSDPKSADFRVFPHVVGAEGRFVLLRARFFFFLSPDEYFMYKASDSESPSLDSVPLPPPDADDDLRRVREFGIVPRGNGGHYLLAALSEAHDAPLDYKLHTYSSERKTWSSITLLNPCTEVKRIIPEKVITIGEGVLGWVDFSCGLLVCNLNEDPPNANFIPLPLPLPGNKDKLRASLTSGHSPRLFRDIACVDGVLKFIEVEHRVIDIMPEKSSDPSDKGLLYDSDLIMSLKRKDMDEKPKKQHSGYRWRAVTWSRMILSNCWHKERTIDVSDIMGIEFSDILAAESTYSSVPPGLGVKSLEEWKLYSAFPTFSMDGSGSFYLKSTVEPNDRDGWVLAVDPENKMVRLFGAWSFAKPKRGYFLQAFRSCTLSNHLKMTPGIKASAYRNITRAGSCADDPNKTPMCVNAISCKWRSKFQRSSAKEVSRARNEAPIVAQNIRVSGAVLNPVEDRRVIQAREIRRILSEEIFNRAQNENRRMVQNHNFSCVTPGRNILPPQQSISNWNWPHNNEYQPVLQQPPSSQQQQMPNQLWNP